MLNLSYNQFIRTAKKEHFAGAQKLWSSFKKEDIYKKITKVFIVLDARIQDGKILLTENALTILRNAKSKKKIIFQVVKLSEKLEELIESDTLKIVPEYRK